MAHKWQNLKCEVELDGPEDGSSPGRGHRLLPAEQAFWLVHLSGGEATVTWKNGVDVGVDYTAKDKRPRRGSVERRKRRFALKPKLRIINIGKEVGWMASRQRSVVGCRKFEFSQVGVSCNKYLGFATVDCARCRLSRTGLHVLSSHG